MIGKVFDEVIYEWRGGGIFGKVSATGNSRVEYKTTPTSATTGTYCFDVSSYLDFVAQSGQVEAVLWYHYPLKYKGRLCFFLVGNAMIHIDSEVFVRFMLVNGWNVYYYTVGCNMYLGWVYYADNETLPCFLGERTFDGRSAVPVVVVVNLENMNAEEVWANGRWNYLAPSKVEELSEPHYAVGLRVTVRSTSSTPASFRLYRVAVARRESV